MFYNEEKEMEENKVIKGFKVFDPDWTCRGYQYEVGKTFEENITPECCKRGFHFCLKASDCFTYYSLNHNNKVAEVIALGKVDYSTEDSKCATNKIQIVREISWDEVQQMINLGNKCTGFYNVGDKNAGNYNTGNYNIGSYNTGDWNTGDWNTRNGNKGNRNTGECNTGNRNTGNQNTGECNTGNRNTGNWNTGDYNTGNCNTGDWNTGNRNTGDWNKSSFNNGCFMTIEAKIMMFNKPSEWTFRDWMNSEAHSLLSCIRKYNVKRINSTKTTDGYFERLDKSECGQLWWDELNERKRNVIRSMPNFDAAIFEEITGIKTE